MVAFATLTWATNSYYRHVAIKKASHTCWRVLGPELIPVCRQSARRWLSHPPGSRLPLLSARPAVAFPAAEHHCPLAATKLYCLVTEARRCEQLAQGCYTAFALGRIWTHDLLISSPTHYTTMPPDVAVPNRNTMYIWTNRKLENKLLLHRKRKAVFDEVLLLKKRKKLEAVKESLLGVGCCR